MAICSRCGKRGLFIRIDADTGLCSACAKADRRIYEAIKAEGRKAGFFRNGVLYDLIPRDSTKTLSDDRDAVYDEEAIIVSDGDIFDPLEPATLNDLRVPDFPEHGGMSMNVTLDLSYIFKQRCEMHSERQFVGSFIQKTLDMMLASPIRWSRSDYIRVILVFYQLGMFVKGDKFESAFRRQNPQVFSSPFDESLEGKSLEIKYYFEQKWHRHQEHETLKRLVPDLAPETYKGYAQIHGRKTKRYLALIEEAAKLGFTPDPGTEKHFCRKYNRHVKMEMQYDTSGKSPRILYCECPLHAAGDCNGKNDFGLLCIYPSTGKQ